METVQVSRGAGYLLIVAVAILTISEGTAKGAGLISGSYELTMDWITDKTATGTTRTDRSKNTLDLKYKGFLAPVIQNEVTFKVEKSRDSMGPDTTKIFPSVSLGYKGSYWNAGAKRTIEDSNEPGRTPSITDTYFMEVFLVPPRRLPDFKGKYTLETNFQEGTTDARKTSWNLSSNYRPYEWLDLKGDYTRNLNDDLLRADSDTEDEKVSGTGSVRHFISDKIKLDIQYKVEKNSGATLLSAGGAKNQKEEETQTVKNLISLRPFRDTTVDASFDGELKQNFVSGEHNLTGTYKVTGSQKIGEPYDLKADAGRTVTEARHTADDNKKTEDTYTVDLRAKYSRVFDFYVKYLKKDTVEDHPFDLTKNTSSGNEEWTGSWVAQILPTLGASFSYDKNDTFTRGAKSAIDTRYNLKANAAIKEIRLTIDPSYEIAFKNDMVTRVKSEIRDFRVVLTYKPIETNNINSLLSHTYARKEDSLANNINRTDSTSANLTWRDPLPGWMVGFDVTRQATDTSNDDLPPDITTNFGVKASYKYRQLLFDTTVKYDKKNIADNSESFDAKVGWTAPYWDASLTYAFKKTFSAAPNESESIGFVFRYIF
ncbi:MAG: hypothetical protein HY896_07960 [Deltaproteobacteria bacterium]|nr:hypothetical protein [Deltaproteobacteria bacterium]